MPNIQCIEFKRLLEAAVETRRAPDAVLAVHAASCNHCRSSWEQYLLLEETLPEWIAAVPETDLADSLLARLAFENSEVHPGPVRIATSIETVVSEPPRGPAIRGDGGRRWTVPAALFAGAAAAVVAVLLIPSPRGNRANMAREPVESAVAQPDASSRNNNLTPIDARRSSTAAGGTELTLAVRDAGAAYLGLASGAADALTQGAVLLPPAAMISRANRAGGVEPTWVDRVRGDLTPLGQRLEGALDFLIDAFPAEPTPAT